MEVLLQKSILQSRLLASMQATKRRRKLNMVGQNTGTENVSVAVIILTQKDSV
jgi:hypothetical protein